MQVYQIQELCHGVMMVGPSGAGKTSTWRVLLEAMEAVDGIKGDAHVIDPKSLSKEELCVPCRCTRAAMTPTWAHVVPPWALHTSPTP